MRYDFNPKKYRFIGVEKSYNLYLRNRKEKKYKGIGTMGAMQFMHMAAMFGLVPLYCFTFGEIVDNSLGPAIFIQKGLKKELKDYSTENANAFFKGIVT